MLSKCYPHTGSGFVDLHLLGMLHVCTCVTSSQFTLAVFCMSLSSGDSEKCRVLYFAGSIMLSYSNCGVQIQDLGGGIGTVPVWSIVGKAANLSMGLGFED